MRFSRRERRLVYVEAGTLSKVSVKGRWQEIRAQHRYVSVQNGGSQSEWECSEEIMICVKVGTQDCRYDLWGGKEGRGLFQVDVKRNPGSNSQTYR